MIPRVNGLFASYIPHMDLDLSERQNRVLLERERKKSAKCNMESRRSDRLRYYQSYHIPDRWPENMIMRSRYNSCSSSLGRRGGGIIYSKLKPGTKCLITTEDLKRDDLYLKCHSCGSVFGFEAMRNWLSNYNNNCVHCRTGWKDEYPIYINRVGS